MIYGFGNVLSKMVGSMYRLEPILCTVQLLTAEFAADLDNGLSWGQEDGPLFVTSNRFTAVKYVLGRSDVVFCVCEIVKLFSAVFYVVRTEHKAELCL